ncbi:MULTISPECIES: DUF3631 domain-containing protein [Streptomyces]|uniref:DUF3631 domain-containing protein n=1 Tax=Streptomyces TaxID=1883 RepID=UPI00163C2C59|nr:MULTISPECIES: DUF3631 domain-containing protein [Streptomyces]MBC2878078.1 DUF3631 domain-containing protein [Streptomyces sp. TYQ1024]UBI40027.1 DUF3631 domain-containing protein [Streptomyces mobaraensis]UKW32607.1 DUF3631 domain-containing protein [Streptomyces sp. TYQ1024]
MTTSPALLEALVTRLLTEGAPLQENPHHRRLLETFLTIQHIDEHILDVVDGGARAFDELVDLTELLLARLQAGGELRALLSSACCCTPTTADGAPADTAEAPDPRRTESSDSIVEACLKVFADRGGPDAMASTDLVAALQHLPGVAENRWRYADLTPIRLANLLSRYEIAPRDVTLSDGRRRKSYRRAALQAAGRERRC